MWAYGQLRLIPIRPVPPTPAARAPVDARWHWRHLMLAPHRLGFFFALVVLVAAGAWWALVQLDRFSGLLALPYVLPPALVHGAVMTFGFIPLFFSGFLFTAGPKWLGVQPPATRQLLRPMVLQMAGWLLWIAAAQLHPALAVGALLIAWLGLVDMARIFWALVRRSTADDQLHARTIGVALLVGCASLAALLAAVTLDAYAVALACVLSALWGFVVVVYVCVAHRMIPFFTSSAMPFINARRPFWALGLMVTVAAAEVLAVWVELGGAPSGAPGRAWTLGRGIFELIAGGVFLWLSVVWGLMQSLKNRLLAMLHVGFLWLGLALVLGGVAQCLGVLQGAPVLSLGALHALTMGCLASLMLAMVTRVSCGHSGRALVADNLVWGLFWLLQLATVLRIAAAAHVALGHWLLLPAALLWVGVMLAWGVRLGSWYGRLRADGRPG